MFWASAPNVFHTRFKALNDKVHFFEISPCYFESFTLDSFMLVFIWCLESIRCGELPSSEQDRANAFIECRTTEHRAYLYFRGKFLDISPSLRCASTRQIYLHEGKARMRTVVLLNNVIPIARLIAATQLCISRYMLVRLSSTTHISNSVAQIRVL